MDLTAGTILLGAAAALLVGFAKTGMPGAGIPAVALMAEVFRDNTKQSVGALLPLLILGDLFAIVYYRRHADWRRLLELCPYVVAGMVPAYLVLRFVDDDALRVSIGVLILVLLLVHVIRQRYGFRGLSDRWWLTATTGILAGFATTVSNAAGPVMGIYLVGRHMDKHQFLGTSAWFFFLVNVSKIPGYAVLGMLTADTFQFDLLLMPIVAAGAVLGIRILKRIPQAAFDVLVLALAGVAAVRMVLV
jgi:hypothetical protein